MQQCIKILLFYIYIKLNMFRATHRPSSGAYVEGFFGRVVGGRCEAQYVPDNVHQLHVLQTSTYEKTQRLPVQF